ncbi:MAG: transcription elongation factor GreAB, partial [Verrucomicrobiota bacterium JB024]|nr:transcription elongation factor GreAB [Verrucomicrobiota bacterium JB024]
MDKDVIDTIIAKQPGMKRLRSKLEAMQPGTYCMHRSWGFGQIVSYDEAQDKLIIDFDEKPGHAMDPAFCADKLVLLDASSILVRQRTEPDAVAEMIKKRPGDL